MAVSTQEKRSEKAFYDDLFGRRQRFDQFQMEIYERIAHTAADGAPGRRTIELGCGSGSQAICLARCGMQTLATDLSIEGCRVARATVEGEGLSIAILNADAEHLPVSDRVFDACICGLLLHHFADFSRVADEIARVLRPGGVVVALDANAHNPAQWVFMNVLHRLKRNPRLTPNQRALWKRELVSVFGARGFEGFQFESVKSELRKDWLGDSPGAWLNYHTRKLVLGLTDLVLPPIARGNLLLAVFRKSDP